jgi:hypothetical protein
MNHLLITRHVIFDESPFPFASSDPPPDDLDSLFSSSPVGYLIVPPYPSSIAGTSELVTVPHAALTPHPAPRAASASHFIEPPWCTSDVIQPPRRSPLTPDRLSTTPSPWLVTTAARTRWSLIVLPGSPSPLTVYNSQSLSLPRHCLRSRPLSVACSQTPTGITLWRSMRPCCLTSCGAWFLGLLGPMSSPVSVSSSTSSRQMALLIDTRLVGSSEASLSVPGWTTMRPSAPSSSLPSSGLC